MNSILFSIPAVIADQKVPLQRGSPTLIPPPLSAPLPTNAEFQKPGLGAEKLIALAWEGGCAL